jgi:hypothetical protein
MQDGWWLAKCLRRYLALREQTVSYRCYILAELSALLALYPAIHPSVLAIEILTATGVCQCHEPVNKYLRP